MKEDIVKSFNKIALLEDKWDNNQHYQKLLIKEVDNPEGIALDLGCGTGEFTQILSKKVIRVFGIDISPVMIEEARKRHSQENIQYSLQDFDEMDEEIKYDYIVSIATFHHLELELALPKIGRMLKDGGKLIVLDLYQRKGILDILLDCIAVPMNLVLKKLKNKRLSEDPREVEAWKEHSLIDQYMAFSELKNLYQEHLSEDIKIKRLLYWRYLLVYKKKL